MRRISKLIVKWITNKLGYKIVMIKVKNNSVTIDGDKELLQYIDLSGYVFKTKH